MGQAKLKAKLMQDWKATLSDDELTVLNVATRLHRDFIKPRNSTGMCYHSVFFLYLYLKGVHGVTTSPVIGYINDGTDDIFISHAWLEFNDKRTDVSIAVSDPRIAPPGQLVILDRVMREGHKYSYHRKISDAGLDAHERLRGSEMRVRLERKEREHQVMLNLVDDDRAIRSYLDAEPNGFSFAKIASLI